MRLGLIILSEGFLFDSKIGGTGGSLCSTPIFSRKLRGKNM